MIKLARHVKALVRKELSNRLVHSDKENDLVDNHRSDRHTQCKTVSVLRYTRLGHHRHDKDQSVRQTPDLFHKVEDCIAPVIINKAEGI